LVPDLKALCQTTSELIKSAGGTELALVHVGEEEGKKGLQFAVAVSGTNESVRTVLRETANLKKRDTTSSGAAPYKYSGVSQQQNS